MAQKYDSVMSVLKVHQMNEPYNLFKFLPVVGYLDLIFFYTTFKIENNPMDAYKTI